MRGYTAGQRAEFARRRAEAPLDQLGPPPMTTKAQQQEHAAAVRAARGIPPRPSARASAKAQRRNALQALKAGRVPRKARDTRQVSLDLRRQILIRDSYTCRYCLRSKTAFHVDHVVPWSHGGRTHPSNLVTACKRCNERKGEETWEPRPLRETRAA